MQLGFTFQPALWELPRFTGDANLRSVFAQIHQPKKQKTNKQIREKAMLASDTAILQHQLQDEKRTRLMNHHPREHYEIKTNKAHI